MFLMLAMHCLRAYYRCTHVMYATSNSCNMETRDLPDMYARSLRAMSWSPRAEGMHIRQIMSAHVTTNMIVLPPCTVQAWVSTKQLRPCVCSVALPLN